MARDYGFGGPVDLSSSGGSRTGGARAGGQRARARPRPPRRDAPRATYDPRARINNSRGVGQQGTGTRWRDQSGGYTFEEADGETASIRRGDRLFGEAFFGPGGPLAGAPQQSANSHLQHGRYNRPISATMFIAGVNRMNEDELIQFQQRLVNLGLFTAEADFEWGRLDADTREAAMQFFYESTASGTTLSDLADQGIDPTPGSEFDPNNPNRAGNENIDLSAEQINLTNTDTLISYAMDSARNLLGRELTDAERQTFVAGFHDKEEAQGRAKIQQGAKAEQAANQQAAAMGDPSSGTPGTEEVDRFMRAISITESGSAGGDYTASNPSGAFGRYQFMPSSWRAWTAELGMDPNDKSPAAQDRVARSKMLQYFNTYHNWRDVAIAWYAGGGGVKKVHEGGGHGDEHGYPSIVSYADGIVRNMGDPGGAAATPAGGTITGEPVVYENLDPAAAADEYAKQADPVGWSSHRVADRFSAFSELLNGPQGATA